MRGSEAGVIVPTLRLNSSFVGSSAEGRRDTSLSIGVAAVCVISMSGLKPDRGIVPFELVTVICNGVDVERAWKRPDGGGEGVFPWLGLRDFPSFVP